MILTVTPNPSVDRTVMLTGLRRGEVQRASASREDAGGKGVNVSRALALAGTPTTAVLPVGGSSGGLLLVLLADAGVPVRAVPVADAVRSNIALVEPDGTTTKVNELGPVLGAAERAALDGSIRELATGASWVVGSGSLPRGLDDGYYLGLLAIGHELGVRVAVDSSGKPMARALAGRPALVKPNRVELAEAVGRELGTLGAVVDAAHELLAGGIERVLVSLGRDGAVLVTGEGAVHGTAHGVRPVSTVGAGDALLAGYLHADSRGAGPREALATAIAFGSAAVALPGSQMPTPAGVAAVDVLLGDTPPLDLPLAD